MQNSCDAAGLDALHAKKRIPPWESADESISQVAFALAANCRPSKCKNSTLELELRATDEGALPSKTHGQATLMETLLAHARSASPAMPRTARRASAEAWDAEFTE
jgi:hypothetical protein